MEHSRSFAIRVMPNFYRLRNSYLSVLSMVNSYLFCISRQTYYISQSRSHSDILRPIGCPAQVLHGTAFPFFYRHHSWDLGPSRRCQANSSSDTVSITLGRVGERNTYNFHDLGQSKKKESLGQ